MSEKKIFIDDSGALSPGDIRARARRVVREQGDLGLIVIDYIQLMRACTMAIQSAQSTYGTCCCL